jgi:hypothetical protein
MHPPKRNRAEILMDCGSGARPDSATTRILYDSWNILDSEYIYYYYMKIADQRQKVLSVAHRKDMATHSS